MGSNWGTLTGETEGKPAEPVTGACDGSEGASQKPRRKPRRSVNLGTFRMIKLVDKAVFNTSWIIEEDEWSTTEVLAFTGEEAGRDFWPVGDCEELECLMPDYIFTQRELATLRDILVGYEFDRREAFLRIHYTMAKLKKGIEELTLESVRDCTKDVWFGELDDVSVPDMFERFIDQNPEAYTEGYVSEEE